MSHANAKVRLPAYNALNKGTSEYGLTMVTPEQLVRPSSRINSFVTLRIFALNPKGMEEKLLLFLFQQFSCTEVLSASSLRLQTMMKEDKVGKL